jgi:phospholipid-translocating ATPase
MEDWRRTVLDNELNNARTKTLHEWHNVNVVDEHISLWRRIKKATSRSIRLMSARRKGIKTDPHELERSSTVIRLSESSVRHPDGDRRDSVIETPRASRDQYADTYGGGSNAYAMGTMKSQRDSNGFVTAPSSPRDDIFVQQSPGVKQEPSVIDPFRSTPQKAKFRTTFWKNVRVGDFILVRSDDQIPADIVVLATSDSDGACYVETKNLDGETNLKVRHALRCGSTIRSAHDCEAASFWIESEGAGSNLYSYNGVARWYNRDPNHPEVEPEMKAEPVSIENLLLRGCNLKNTDWIIGVVMFTGQETRIMMNSGITPSKRSFISRSLNWNVPLP